MRDPHQRDTDGLLPPRTQDPAAATEQLVLAVRHALDPASPPPPLRVPSEDLVEMARRHRVAGLLLQVADVMGLDQQDVEVLRAVRTRDVHQAMVVQAAALHAVRTLEAAGIRSLVYKGVALAARTTGDPTSRGGGDVDLLVHPDDVEAAHEALLAGGCSFKDTWSPAPGSAQWPAARYISPEHSYAWRGVPLDLHWRIDLAPQVFSVPFDDLWERREVAVVSQHPLPTLGDHDALLVTAVHGTKERWRRLRWVVDAARQARALEPSEWEDVLAWARATGSDEGLGIALAVAESLMGAPVAPVRAGPRARVWADRWWEGMLADTLAGQGYSWRSGLARAQWWWGTAPARARWRRVAVFVVPVQDLLELPLPPVLLPLYVPLRPLLRRRRAHRRAR